ncbi:putative FAD-binding domain, FAD/NAD(P)-binding domain-containing protein [Rosa chinensis]|uniref:Putative FAD-binding domain, FAD/NAD(P)-binding domain-containing protein n=2 Tax=Rosa chinensis TaxID=74649 RepID=A0A2P6P8T6_ROSCH|nr:monooxygenase 2 isoform X1 [Rosa chinensis]PRQ18345.1 putative FAD-binding domain, FAD/NAD(P)-binding domain-containing protein [Rosa chinensis]
MGVVSFSLVLHSSLVSPYHSQTRNPLGQSNWFRAPTTTRTKPTSLSIIRAQSGARKEEIVIVGAGIAGLATALSLHRLGIGSVVLEQAESLRTSGTSLTLFKNGWRVLDAIGVGDDLRTQFLEIQGMVVTTAKGNELRSFKFKEEDESQEVRAVERRILLETLANQLPQGAVRFSSKLAKIEKSEDGDTSLQLVDDTQLSAKIVIGCDGIRSPIAKWMGFPEPKYAGHCGLRGLAFFPGGHKFEPKLNQIYGRGQRAGIVPISPTKVYWFVCFNRPSPGPKINDPAVLKKLARELVTNWPSDLLDIIDHTPDDTISRTPLVDRWLWPSISPPASAGRVVLVGDAWHPMTPNLGQGACCALEDSVILARKLAAAIDSGPAAIEDALSSYGNERWPRIFPLTIRANLIGSLLQWENPVVCSVRNNVIIPKLVKLGPMLEHTNFDCQPLQNQVV